jgi:hypothetical protein
MSHTHIIDVFNGDADGICALHQLRLAQPASSTLITGVKRDIALLRQVPPQAGIQVNVFDISLDANIDALQTLLEHGASIRYFDHHAASKQPSHPALHSFIDEAADVCSSLLVDRYLNGAFRPWAIAAAFGDNLNGPATALAQASGLNAEKIAQLQELGTLLNYNAYGETVSDLAIAPATLYQAIKPYTSAFDFIEHTAEFRLLRDNYAADNTRLGQLQPLQQQPHAAVYLLPPEKWARRISGILANRLASAQPQQAFAILNLDSAGDYLISVRAPKGGSVGAVGLCSQYPSGGGRFSAGGINHLPAEQRDDFIQRFFAYFAPTG